MRRRIRNMPSASMVVAFTALLLALGGTAVALPGNNTVTSGDIRNGQVKTQDIRNSTVRTQDIRNGGVLGKDVRNGTLTGADVRNNSLTGADVDESTLATVPRAIVAAGSDTANTANFAASSGSTSGIERGTATTPSTGGDRLLARAGGIDVVLSASDDGDHCDYDVEVRNTTSEDAEYAYDGSAIGTQTTDSGTISSGSHIDPISEAPGGTVSTDPNEVTLMVTTGSGAVVRGILTGVTNVESPGSCTASAVLFS